MLEEKTKHFPCCVRSSRIRVGARRTPSGPCVSGSVDIPVLNDSAPTRAGMDRAGIGMPSSYLPAMHLLLRARRSHRLLKNLIAIVWMHRYVAVAVKNNGRDRWPVARNDPATGSTTLPHGGKCGGHISGGPGRRVISGSGRPVPAIISTATATPPCIQTMVVKSLNRPSVRRARKKAAPRADTWRACLHPHDPQ